MTDDGKSSISNPSNDEETGTGGTPQHDDVPPPTQTPAPGSPAKVLLEAPAAYTRLQETRRRTKEEKKPKLTDPPTGKPPSEETDLKQSRTYGQSSNDNKESEEEEEEAVDDIEKSELLRLDNLPDVSDAADAENEEGNPRRPGVIQLYHHKRSLDGNRLVCSYCRAPRGNDTVPGLVCQACGHHACFGCINAAFNPPTSAAPSILTAITESRLPVEWRCPKCEWNKAAANREIDAPLSLTGQLHKTFTVDHFKRETMFQYMIRTQTDGIIKFGDHQGHMTEAYAKFSTSMRDVKFFSKRRDDANTDWIKIARDREDEADELLRQAEHLANVRSKELEDSVKVEETEALRQRDLEAEQIKREFEDEQRQRKEDRERRRQQLSQGQTPSNPSRQSSDLPEQRGTSGYGGNPPPPNQPPPDSGPPELKGTPGYGGFHPLPNPPPQQPMVSMEQMLELVRTIQGPQQPATGVHQKQLLKQVVSARIAEMTFKGDVVGYPPFKREFHSLVVNDSALKEEDKIHILRARLSAEVRKKIAAIEPNLPGNLKVCLEILETNYGNRGEVEAELRNRIRHLRPPKPQDAQSLDKFIDTLKSSSYELVQLNKERFKEKHDYDMDKNLETTVIDQFAMDIFAKLDNTTQYALHNIRLLQTNGAPERMEWEMMPLIEALRRLQLQQRMIEASQGRLPQPKSGAPTPGPSGVTHVNPSGPNRSEPPTRRRSVSASSQKEGWGCPWCKSTEHNLFNCKNTTIEQRVKVIQDEKRCLNCLNRRHREDECLNPYRCKSCGEKHHTMVHGAHDPPPAKNQPKKTRQATPSAPRSRQATPAPEEGSAQPPQQPHEVSLSWCTGKVEYAEEPRPDDGVPMVSMMLFFKTDFKDTTGGPLREGRVFMDTGSSKTLLTTSMATRLGLTKLKSISFNSSVPHTATPVFVSGWETKLLLVTPMGTKVSIIATVVKNIAGKVPVHPVELPLETLQKIQELPKGTKILNQPPDEEEAHDIDLLIGLDEYHKILGPGNSTVERLSPSGHISLYKTAFGPLLAGAAPLADTKGRVPSGVQMLNATGIDHEDKLHPFRDIDKAYEDLRQQIEDLQDLEHIGMSLPDAKTKPTLDQLTQELGKRTTFLKGEGRFEVPLPIKDPKADQLGDNYRLSTARTLSMLNRLHSTNTGHLESYLRELRAYGPTTEEGPESGIIERVTEGMNDKYAARVKNGETRGLWKHFLSHFPVISTDETKTTKIRPVFDAAAKTRDGRCLNTLLEKGPQLTEGLLEVGWRLRTGKHAFLGDVQRAFLQIGVKEEDRDSLRFFLPAPDAKPPFKTNDLEEWRFRRLPMGATSSPWILNAVHRLMLERFGEYVQMNEEEKTLFMRSLYVDNVSMSFEDTEEGARLMMELTKLYKFAAFRLRGFASNNQDAVEMLPEEARAPDQETQNFLGTVWHLNEDEFSIANPSVPSTPATTKREILSVLASYYDPNGFASPLLLQGRLEMKDQWATKVGWDDPLPPEVCEKWALLHKEFSRIGEIRIPRRVVQDKKGAATLVGFADASPTAYSWVVYVHQKINDAVSLRLLFSKSRVAPSGKKQVATIPRLELIALCLMAQSLQTVRTALELELNLTQVVAYSDSLVALAWATMGKSLRSFESKRVMQIQDADVKDLRYVPTKENPADVGTRAGVDFEKLTNSNFYTGPDFLQENVDNWINPSLKEMEMPSEEEFLAAENYGRRKKKAKSIAPLQTILFSCQHQNRLRYVATTEERTVPDQIVCLSAPHRPSKVKHGEPSDQPPEEEEDGMEALHPRNFSSLTSLLTNSAIILRLHPPEHPWSTAKRLEPEGDGKKGKRSFPQGKVEKWELDWALKWQVFRDQQRDFKPLYDRLTSEPVDPVERRVKGVDQFLDENKLIRVKGRLAWAPLSNDARHPVFLDKYSPLLRLLVRHTHLAHVHAPPKSIYAILQDQFYFGGKVGTVERALRGWCVPCIKFRGRGLASPHCGQLPELRVTIKPPFAATGMDHAGPFWVWVETGGEDGKGEYVKVWVGLFVCGTTRGVHLEAINEPTAAAVVRSVVRFVAKRGYPKNMVIYADNALCFRALDKVLTSAFAAEKKDLDTTFKSEPALSGIKMTFIPSRSPHFGGSYERIVGVMKAALGPAMLGAKISRDEFETLLCRVEAALNERPLLDPEDGDEPFTPATFLVQGNGLRLPTAIHGYPKTGSKAANDLLKRRQVIDKLEEMWWVRFLRQYLPSLRSTHAATMMRYGAVQEQPKLYHYYYLQTEEPAMRWPVAQVVKMSRDEEGSVRTVQVYTNGQFRNVAVKFLVPFELNAEGAGVQKKVRWIKDYDQEKPQSPPGALEAEEGDDNGQFDDPGPPAEDPEDSDTEADKRSGDEDGQSETDNGPDSSSDNSAKEDNHVPDKDEVPIQTTIDRDALERAERRRFHHLRAVEGPINKPHGRFPGPSLEAIQYWEALPTSGPIRAALDGRRLAPPPRPEMIGYEPPDIVASYSKFKEPIPGLGKDKVPEVVQREEEETEEAKKTKRKLRPSLRWAGQTESGGPPRPYDRRSWYYGPRNLRATKTHHAARTASPFAREGKPTPILPKSSWYSKAEPEPKSVWRLPPERGNAFADNLFRDRVSGLPPLPKNQIRFWKGPPTEPPDVPEGEDVLTDPSDGNDAPLPSPHFTLPPRQPPTSRSRPLATRGRPSGRGRARVAGARTSSKEPLLCRSKSLDTMGFRRIDPRTTAAKKP